MMQATTPTSSTSTKPGTFHRHGVSPYSGNFLLTPSLAEYLAPDITLPEQYYLRNRNDDGMGPEKALMYAVLKDAIRSFYKNVGATRRKYKKVLLEAETWIGDDDWESPFSFLVICDTLGIDGPNLRAHLMGWKDAELARREQTGETGRPSSRSAFPSPLAALDAAGDLGIEVDDEEDADWGDDSRPHRGGSGMGLGRIAA